MGRKKVNAKNKHSISKQNTCQFKKEINAECDKLLHLSSDPYLINNLWDNYVEISQTLDKIKALEDVKLEVTNRLEAIDEFENWLKENGAKFDGISIQDFSEYDLGLQAETDFTENEPIIKIPRKLIFNVHTAASELEDIKTDMLIQHMPQVALTIALLIEKSKDNSKWKPYLNILPKVYSTVLYIKPEDMIVLKGSPSLEPALKQCRNIARQYAYFHKLFQNSTNPVANLLKNNFTYEEYRWAVSTVMTRQNVIPNKINSEMIHSLIPLWDICNHEEGRITTDFIESSDCCECYAMRNFKAGDQIFIYYGPRTNTEFFVHSGFVYPENKSDYFKIRLGISKSDPLQKERIEALTKIGLPASSEFILKPIPKLIFGSLLGFLRIFNMSKPELDHWVLNSKSINDIIRGDCPIDEAIDKKVLQYIKTRVQLLIATYSASEKKDNEIINASPDNCRKIILQLKLSEKVLLQKILVLLENADKI